MSNIVKSFYINSGEDKRVIDYNELIQEKIKLAEEARKTAVFEPFDADGEDGSEEFGDGFTLGLNAEVVEVDEEAALAHLLEEQEQAHVAAEGIIAQANAEAEQILVNAKKDADAMWEKAYAEAKRDGYEAGIKDGRAEIERMRNDFLKEKKQQQSEYVEMLESMESDLVGIMLEVFERVTKVLSADKKDIMVHLIDNALNHIESSKEFVIRVSKDDYQFVTKHKEFLQEAVPQNGSLEIVKDATLERNQCLIETDGGIFDCSLDVQLENLIMDVKALSCM